MPHAIVIFCAFFVYMTSHDLDPGWQETLIKTISVWFDQDEEI